MRRRRPSHNMLPLFFAFLLSPLFTHEFLVPVCRSTPDYVLRVNLSIGGTGTIFILVVDEKIQSKRHLLWKLTLKPAASLIRNGSRLIHPWLTGFILCCWEIRNSSNTFPSPRHSLWHTLSLYSTKFSVERSEPRNGWSSRRLKVKARLHCGLCKNVHAKVQRGMAMKSFTRKLLNYLFVNLSS